MIDILSLIPGKKRATPSGWHTFNCPACMHLGHRPDSKYRGAVIFHDQYDWTFKCFNCHHRCSFVIGRLLSFKTKQLLRWCGVDEQQISKWNIASLKQRDFTDFEIPISRPLIPHFKETDPPDAEILDINNPSHQKYVDYLSKRGIDITHYPLLVTPDEYGRNSDRIIVPFTYEGKFVGYAARYMDNKNPKFFNQFQPGYVFGTDLQKPNWSIAIVVEGLFDALSIDGIATMHDEISQENAAIIAKLNKRIIYVPDLDKQGLAVIDRALDLGYNIALPEWDDTVKDVNDAVVKYGKLPTLMSIIQSATRNKVKIDIRKRQISKRNKFDQRI
jgi:hypothetical protein